MHKAHCTELVILWIDDIRRAELLVSRLLPLSNQCCVNNLLIICRVPKSSLAPGTTIEDPITGCRGCASGLDCEENIFGNKYGQDLAGIQIAREERSSMIQNMQGEEEAEDQEEEEEQEQEQEEDSGPVGAADGSSGRKSHVWRDQQEEEDSSASKKHRVE